MAAKSCRKSERCWPVGFRHSLSKLTLEQRHRVGFRKAAQQDRVHLAPQNALTTRNNDTAFGRGVEDTLQIVARQVHIVQEYKRPLAPKSHLQLRICRLEGHGAFIKGVEERLENIRRRCPSRRKVGDAMREARRLVGVRKTAQKGSLPDARLTGDFHWNAGANSDERLRQFGLTVKPPAQRPWAHQYGAGPLAGLGLLAWGHDVHNAAMNIADLKDVATDGDLAGDVALNVSAD